MPSRFNAKSCLVGLMAAILSLAAAVGVQAQTPAAAPASQPAGDPELQRQYRAAFDAMLADPGNLDKTFRFAQLAIRINDLEGAVGALERMLVINPNLPRIRLELGVLYYRLGSFEAARAYLQSALASRDLPPEVRSRAEQVLAEIDKQRNPSRFFGSVMSGMRYQTNANAAPGGGVVKVGGIDSQLGPSGTAQKDWNVFGLAAINHTYDLGTQEGDFIDSRLVLYGARQFKASDVNLVYSSISSGPRMRFLPDTLPGTTVRPAAYFDYVMLADRTEYIAPGVGVGFEHRIAQGQIALNFDYRYRNYHDSREKPTNSNRDGNDFGVRLAIERTVLPWLVLMTGGSSGLLDARRNFETYWELSAWVGIGFQLEELSLIAGQRGTLAFSVARVWSNYDAPDPTIDPGVRRKDRDWRLSSTLSMPVYDAWSVVLQGGVTDRRSTLPNYEYTNWFGTLGVAWRF